MYGFVNSTPTITIVACEICQAPTKNNRLTTLFTDSNIECCMVCAHTQHTQLNVSIKDCIPCSRIKDGSSPYPNK